MHGRFPLGPFRRNGPELPPSPPQDAIGTGWTSSLLRELSCPVVSSGASMPSLMHPMTGVQALMSCVHPCPRKFLVGHRTSPPRRRLYRNRVARAGAESPSAGPHPAVDLPVRSRPASLRQVLEVVLHVDMAGHEPHRAVVLNVNLVPKELGRSNVPTSIGHVMEAARQTAGRTGRLWWSPTRARTNHIRTRRFVGWRQL